MLHQPLRNYAWVWAACAGFAALADLLFYGHPWGVNAALFAALVVAALLVRSPGLWRSRMGRTWVLLAGLVLFALVEEPSPLAVLMAALTLGTLVIASQSSHTSLGDRVSAWIAHWCHFLATLFLRLLFDNAIVARWIARHPQAGRRLMAAATAIAWWFFPLLAGGLFIALFAIANPLIARGLRRFSLDLLTLFEWLPNIISPFRVLLWIWVILGIYGMLRYRGLRLRQPSIPPVVAPPPLPRWWNGNDMIIRCLLVFNAVFALQTLLDILYLYGGAALPEGMTYAHYAHRGAYPLIATALLAGLFVLLAFRRNGPAERSPWARRLVYLWILQNLFLLFSTIWRIWLYVDVYSLTRLRISAAIWVLLVALGFCWIVAKIVARRDNAWLWRMNVRTAFALLFACAFINFDGYIADFNVRHCREITGEGVPIDLAYLEDLGPESLPALDWLHRQPGVDRAAIAKTTATLTADLRLSLHDWRGWTFRRWRQDPSDLRPPFVVRHP